MGPAWPRTLANRGRFDKLSQHRHAPGSACAGDINLAGLERGEPDRHIPPVAARLLGCCMSGPRSGAPHTGLRCRVYRLLSSPVPAWLRRDRAGARPCGQSRERGLSALQYRARRPRRARAGTAADHARRRGVHPGPARDHAGGEPARHPRPPERGQGRGSSCIAASPRGSSSAPSCSPTAWRFCGADLSNGLLSIDLARPEPERIVRKIDILGRD